MKLGKEVIGRRLVTDVVQADGRILVARGTIITEELVNKLINQGITIVLIEPPSSNRTVKELDRMFAKHTGDPYMEMLHKAAVALVEPKDERTPFSG